MRIQAALLKREVEAKLAGRIPAALSPLPQQAPRLHPTGNEHLDSLLGGGLPLGSLCELSGTEGSGRSSIALSLLAEASREGACAWIDANDMLSAHGAAAAGANLNNLLWVRLTARKRESSPAGPRQGHVAFAAGRVPIQPFYGGCGSSHLRYETNGLAPALEDMLFQKEERRKRKAEGTPGHRNQPLGLRSASQDQIEWERFNLRRVDETDPLRQSDQKAAIVARQQAALQSPASIKTYPQTTPLDRLERALRAADQIMQSGGFRVVVLDIASTPADQALRIPSATWFRFRRAAQESDAILLLLTKEPCARSSAACVLTCSPGEPPRIDGVFTSATRHVEIARQRTGPSFGKKAPGRATSWEAIPALLRTTGR